MTSRTADCGPARSGSHQHGGSVVLERVCGHIVSANTLATQRFAACPEFSQCPPDEVLRASDGTLCGIFRGNACNFVKAQIPAFTREQHRDMLREAMNYAASLGLTSVQSNDVGTSVEDADLAFSLLREIYAAGGAPIAIATRSASTILPPSGKACCTANTAGGVSMTAF